MTEIKKRIFWERLSHQTKQNIIFENIKLFAGINQTSKTINFLSVWCATQDINYFRMWHSKESRFVNVLEFNNLDQYVEFCLKYY